MDWQKKLNKIIFYNKLKFKPFWACGVSSKSTQQSSFFKSFDTLYN